MRRMASLLVVAMGAKVTALLTVRTCASPPQLSLDAEGVPAPAGNSSSFGSAMTLGTLNGADASVGPIARMRTVLAVEPPMLKPRVMRPPVGTALRTETLTRRGVA